MKFENYATLTSESYCLSLLQNTFVFLGFYKSGWQCLLGAGFEGDGRDLFLTTLAKSSRAVSESNTLTADALFGF